MLIKLKYNVLLTVKLHLSWTDLTIIVLQVLSKFYIASLSCKSINWVFGNYMDRCILKIKAFLTIYCRHKKLVDVSKVSVCVCMCVCVCVCVNAGSIASHWVVHFAIAG